MTAYPGAGVYLYAGQTFVSDGTLYSRLTDGVTASATFDTAEQANWSFSSGDRTLVLDSIAAYQAATIPAHIEVVTIRGYTGPNTAGGGDLIIDRSDTVTLMMASSCLYLPMAFD